MEKVLSFFIDTCSSSKSRGRSILTKTILRRNYSSRSRKRSFLLDETEKGTRTTLEDNDFYQDNNPDKSLIKCVFDFDDKNDHGISRKVGKPNHFSIRTGKQGDNYECLGLKMINSFYITSRDIKGVFE